jgi:hypothetical protein
MESRHYRTFSLRRHDGQVRPSPVHLLLPSSGAQEAGEIVADDGFRERRASLEIPRDGSVWPYRLAKTASILVLALIGLPTLVVFGADLDGTRSGSAAPTLRRMRRLAGRC